MRSFQFTQNHESGQAGGKSLNREHQPAVQLSWQQAASFCKFAQRARGVAGLLYRARWHHHGFDSASTGYRLPTEAEGRSPPGCKGKTSGDLPGAKPGHPRMEAPTADALFRLSQDVFSMVTLITLWLAPRSESFAQPQRPIRYGW